MHRVACQKPRANTLASPAAFKIKRQHVRGFDRLRRGQSRTDRFAPSGKACEVVKANRTGENYFVEFLKRPVDLDRRAALDDPKLNQLRRIVSIVVDGANALRNEWREQFRLFIRPHGPMNPRGKDDRDVSGRGTVLDQAAHNQVDDLRAAGRARGI